MYDGQVGFFDPDKVESQVTTHIIGLGAYGKVAATLLSKLGARYLVLQDKKNEKVEEKNIAVQGYTFVDLGKKKTVAAEESIKKNSKNVEVVSINEDFKKGSPLLGRIIVSAVDSMKVRKMIWEAVQKDPNVLLFVDFRANGEECQIFYIIPSNPVDVEFYNSELFDDEETSSEICTERGVIDVPAIGTALFVNIYRKFLTGKPIPLVHWWVGSQLKLRTNYREEVQSDSN